ncbi:SseB family protein [Conexibacter sp. SYSU D00693]|uniref:SseB family protein n=1 Tax=Conexibacter sp. SYSU D00693 TaxID=2812560 RepID=UPI00196AC699|nr:SseB family protein [Conexibacter sp. SYSU D00693]
MSTSPEELRRILSVAKETGDSSAVGPALLEAQLVVPVHPGDGAPRIGTVGYRDGREVAVAFTDQAEADAWRGRPERWATLDARAVLDQMLATPAERLDIDPERPQGGYLSRAEAERLAALPRPAGDAPFTPAGSWATEELREAVGAAAAGEDGIDAVWLVDRGDQPSLAVALADGGGPAAIDAVLRAMQPHVAPGSAMEVVVLDAERRAEAQALGAPLGG